MAHLIIAEYLIKISMKWPRMTLTAPWVTAICNLIIGLVLGNILYRGDFCIAGILRDQFLFRDRTLLRPLLLAIGLTLVFFTMARYTGLLPNTPPAVFGPSSLAGIAGGWLFGLGMVLAGGCVISTLYKLGSGNLSHGIAFLGIIAGSVLYAKFQALFDLLHQSGRFTETTLLRQHWALGSELIEISLMLLTIGYFIYWYRSGLLQVTAAAEAYLQPWKIAIGLALLNLTAYLVNGWPLGISTAYLKIGLWLEKLLLPTRALEPNWFFQQNRLTIMPISGTVSDPYLLTELPFMAGIIGGAMMTALLLKEFRVYGLPPWRQGIAAFSGGVVMALGARLANGCNIKFMLGGLPLLSLEALLFVPGMILGAWVGAKLLTFVITPK